MEGALAFCRETVAEAGRLLLSSQPGRQIRLKSSAFDIVTEADQAVQALVIERIHAAFPTHGIIAEEDWSERPGAEHVWYLDPVDGTTNFWHALPFFSVSLALCRAGRPVVGAIGAPALGELYWAALGEGAFSAGGRLQVSSIDRLDRALVATGFPYRREPGSDDNCPEFRRVLPMVQDVRRLGSAALEMAYVAAGRLDGYWELGTDAWDTLAGELLVSEAGGQVSAVHDRPVPSGLGGTLATNGLIHAALRSLLLG